MLGHRYPGENGMVLPDLLRLRYCAIARLSALSFRLIDYRHLPPPGLERISVKQRITKGHGAVAELFELFGNSPADARRALESSM